MRQARKIVSLPLPRLSPLYRIKNKTNNAGISKRANILNKQCCSGYLYLIVPYTLSDRIGGGERTYRLYMQNIEYFKVENNKVIIKEKNCPERFLSTKELKKLENDFKRVKNFNRRFSKLYDQNTNDHFDYRNFL